MKWRRRSKRTPVGSRYLGCSLCRLSLKWLLRKRSRASMHSARHSLRDIGVELAHTHTHNKDNAMSKNAPHNHHQIKLLRHGRKRKGTFLLNPI